MLDRFLDRLVSWSPLRFWTYVVLTTIVVMEAVSYLITSHVPPCTVNADDYGKNYANSNECPAPHVIFIVAMARILEAMGHEWLTALSTVVIAIFTATLWWSTRGMLQATNRSASIAKEALVKLERAFIAPGDFSVRQGQVGQQVAEYEFILSWVNSGSTAAREFLTHINWDTFLTDIPPDFPFTDMGTRILQPIFVSPKTTTKSIPLMIDVAIIEAVRVGHIRLFFYGWVTYRDIFEGTPQHITKFCNELYRVDGDPYGTVPPQILTWHFRPYTRNNCVDEDCT
jgi:hypothetical protein